MNIRLLKSFLALADDGQFGRAASALCMTQPTLSKQILMLEQQLGGRLFERGKHGAVLSNFGELFLPEARQLVSDADALLQRAQLACKGEWGPLRIGFGLSTLSLAPRWVSTFRLAFPAVDVSLNDLSSEEQYRRLAAGDLDLGFVRRPPTSALEFLPLMVERLALSVPVSSAVTALPAALDDLNGTGFVALRKARGPGLAAQIARWCEGRQFLPRLIQEADDIQTVQALVGAGIGMAFLPASAQFLVATSIRTIPLTGTSAEWEVGLAWHPAKLRPTAERFIALLRAAC